MRPLDGIRRLLSCITARCQPCSSCCRPSPSGKDQQALIETSLQLGFVPILASVKPQAHMWLSTWKAVAGRPAGLFDEADWRFIKRREQAEASIVAADPKALKEVEPVS
ncbi:hypothetical protein CH92_02985 [Stutzerimonas stutzeri]|uniref:Uncharacterized protein n=1 Tax=Stutzerimonas stutzeri TaxID=316 RepID=W8R4P9_STUST|nr:hypothetical protein CH92_02985 [Stutzerimonas stutzeri]